MLGKLSQSHGKVDFGVVVGKIDGKRERKKKGGGVEDGKWRDVRRV